MEALIETYETRTIGEFIVPLQPTLRASLAAVAKVLKAERKHWKKTGVKATFTLVKSGAWGFLYHIPQLVRCIDGVAA